jgi:hypothetical protein
MNLKIPQGEIRRGLCYLEQIDPALLQTFRLYGPSDAYGPRYDALYEADDDADSSDAMRNYAIGGDTDVFNSPVVAQVQEGLREFWSGSPSPSETAVFGLCSELRLMSFMHGRARDVAYTGALEAEAGPVLSTMSHVSRLTERFSVSSGLAALTDAVEGPQHESRVVQSLPTAEEPIRDLSKGSRGQVHAHGSTLVRILKTKQNPKVDAGLEERRRCRHLSYTPTNHLVLRSLSTSDPSRDIMRTRKRKAIYAD